MKRRVKNVLRFSQENKMIPTSQRVELENRVQNAQDLETLVRWARVALADSRLAPCYCFGGECLRCLAEEIVARRGVADCPEKPEEQGIARV